MRRVLIAMGSTGSDEQMHTLHGRWHRLHMARHPPLFIVFFSALDVLLLSCSRKPEGTEVFSALPARPLTVGGWWEDPAVECCDDCTASHVGAVSADLRTNCSSRLSFPCVSVPDVWLLSCKLTCSCDGRAVLWRNIRLVLQRPSFAS